MADERLLLEIVEEEKYVEDGSVDLKGEPAFKSKTGGWTASYFIMVYELFERIAFHGITSNLVLYLTSKLHLGTVASANSVTNWNGTGFFLAILGAYIADAHLGRYWTFVISSVIYLLGMFILTLAVSVPSLRPPPCGQDNGAGCKSASALQLGVYFGALYMIALGLGGTKPNISTIGADQFDDFDPGERASKISFFNWWMFSVYLGTLFSNIVLPYIQDNVGFSLGYGLPTVGLAISLAIFLVGTPFYRHKLPQGSPFIRMGRVLVAAVRKYRVPLPKDSSELYELDLEEYLNKKKFRIPSTNSWRVLDKAAVRVGPGTPWMLSTITAVEETKQMLRMIPIWIALFIPSIMIPQVHTLFTKQAATLDRHIGHHFQIPAGSFSTFTTISMLVSIVVYDRYFINVVRKWTKNPRGITLLQRIGIGLVLHIVIMVIASVTEMVRLKTARSHGAVQKGDIVPLTIFVLLPQFALMGLAAAFLEVGNAEFFYNQAPESMKSLGAAYSLATYGVGNFLSSVLLTVVSNITKKDAGKGWILNNLNISHLDYYYTVLAILSAINLVFFLFVSKHYVYKAEIFESEMISADDQVAADKL